MPSNDQDLNQEKTPIKTGKEEGSEKIPHSPSATTPDIPDFGWSTYAERMNGRFAMIGLIAILLIELFSQKPFINWAGLIQ